MPRSYLLSLSELLRPSIGGQTTVMQSPVSVVKKVALTLYYLSDEGRVRKTANAFGLSRLAVSIIISSGRIYAGSCKQKLFLKRSCVYNVIFENGGAEILPGYVKTWPQ